MKVSFHIPFFYNPQLPIQLSYLNRIIEEVNKYGLVVDFFIHTNDKSFKPLLLQNSSGGSIKIFVYVTERLSRLSFNVEM